MDLLEQFHRHGGRIAAAKALFATAPMPWIDLSTGVSPYPYPARPCGRWARSRLPDPDDLATLEVAAAVAFGVDDSRRVAAVPGSEAALRLLPRILGSSSVAVAAPSYASHAEAWIAAGAHVTMIPFAGIVEADAETVILVNPNNPDGLTLPPAAVMEFAARQAERGGWLVVDEAFAEVAPEASVAGRAAERLIVLRSFGKFYGLPGLRLGFVIAGEWVIARIRAAFGDWPVTVDAIGAGIAAYADRAWADRARRRLERAAARLDKALVLAGLEVVGGTGLFRLVRCDAHARFRRLAEAGLLVRPFAHDSRLLRFGLPRGSSAWQRLEGALEGRVG